MWNDKDIEVAIKFCANLLQRVFPIGNASLVTKILLVEGETDATFYGRVIADDVKILNMDRKIGGPIAARSRAETEVTGFRQAKADRGSEKSNSSYRDSCLNHKEIIVNVCRAFKTRSFYPSQLNALIGYDVYGVVDKDDADGKNYFAEGRLFVTDTHDIETLILYSDRRDRYKIDGKELTGEVLCKACYLAHQLKEFRDNVKYKDYLSNAQKKLLEKGNHQYADIGAMQREPDGCKLNLNYIIGYLNLDRKKEADLRRDNKVKNLFEKNTDDWKLSLSDFKKRFKEKSEKNPWNYLNGHDIASAVVAVDPEFDKLSMSFEKALILDYKVINFYNTKLGQALGAANLIKPECKLAA